MTEEEARDLVNEADVDGSGVIEFEEFVILMQIAVKCSSRHVLRWWRLT